MLSKITLSNALLGNEAAGSELLWQAVIDETGFKATSAVNAIGYILWSVWLIAFGIALLLL
jgi:hypothetical protein